MEFDLNPLVVFDIKRIFRRQAKRFLANADVRDVFLGHRKRANVRVQDIHRLNTTIVFHDHVHGEHFLTEIDPFIVHLQAN